MLNVFFLSLTHTHITFSIYIFLSISPSFSQLYDELEVSALSVYMLHMTKSTCTGDFGMTARTDTHTHVMYKKCLKKIVF